MNSICSSRAVHEDIGLKKCTLCVIYIVHIFFFVALLTCFSFERRVEDFARDLTCD